MRIALSAALAALAALAPATTPSAQTPANALAELGLLGRWAIDCARPPEQANAHVHFERTEIDARYRIVFGPGRQTVRRVDAVRDLGGGTIQLQLTNISGDEPGFRIESRIVKQDGRYRVMYAKGSDGKVYVENGVIIANGRANPWNTYCGRN